MIYALFRLASSHFHGKNPTNLFNSYARLHVVHYTFCYSKLKSHVFSSVELKQKYFWKRGRTSTNWLAGLPTMGIKAIPKCIYYKFRCWWFWERLLRELHQHSVFRDQHWIQCSEIPICVHAGQRPPRRRIHSNVYSGHNLHRQQHESQKHFFLLR